MTLTAATSTIAAVDAGMRKTTSCTRGLAEHHVGTDRHVASALPTDRRRFLAGGLAILAASSAAYASEAARSVRPLVALDPGHGGHDSGAVGATGLLEKTVTLDVALLFRDMAARADAYDVVLTRDSDVFVPLADRVRIA